MRWWTTVLVAVASAALGGASCGDGFTCECTPCGAAVSVFVVDDQGTAVTAGWSVAASLDGVAVETSQCDDAARGGANNCGFGFEPGVYQVVLRTPTTDKTFAARFAGRAGQDCCGCIVGESVQVVLP